KLVLGENAPGRLQKLAHWADVDIAFLVESEVSPRKGAVLAYRFVNNRDVRRNLLLVDDPVERRSRSVGAIGPQPLRLSSQRLVGPVYRRLGGDALGLANAEPDFVLDYPCALPIDEIVVGVGEKGRTAHRPRTLRGRIRRREELGPALARRAKGGVIEG